MYRVRERNRLLDLLIESENRDRLSEPRGDYKRQNRTHNRYNAERTEAEYRNQHLQPQRCGAVLLAQKLKQRCQGS